jgi:hypothetical protein
MQVRKQVPRCARNDNFSFEKLSKNSNSNSNSNSKNKGNGKNKGKNKGKNRRRFPTGMTNKKRPAEADRFWSCEETYAFMLTDSCALSAFSSFILREALLRCERSFMKDLAST